jgi:hypothetical protein
MFAKNTLEDKFNTEFNKCNKLYTFIFIYIYNIP